ncbi:UNVERIFIED_CONTAM: hypothetical protein GTU68_025231 [Idotea baltica]|nr:hypothetical protein [Idotea baltica]
MSYCKKQGKDQIIFVTEEDHNTPSKVPFPEEDEEDKPVGLVLPSGEINWGCPCLGGMATGPCGVEFREAFTCFHYSKAETKGSDCLDPFRSMSECMARYPGVYGNKDEEDLMKENLDENNSNDKISEGTSSSNSSEVKKSS